MPEANENLVDVLSSSNHKLEWAILDHGFVKLIDVMPRLCPAGALPEYAIVQAARVSYGHGTKSTSDDAALIRYLLRHAHTSPFEMVLFKFHIKLPIFCMRQLVRHRSASLNEVSARYSELPGEFYLPSPKEVRKQSKTNKQGGDEQADEVAAMAFSADMEDVSKYAYAKYQNALKNGVARELARALLPINIYTELYWEMDLHNLLHFLRLRLDKAAQYEMRLYADAIYQLISKFVPTVLTAFEDYRINAITLSETECDVLRQLLSGTEFELSDVDELISYQWENKREQSEFRAKLLQLIERK